MSKTVCYGEYNKQKKKFEKRIDNLKVDKGKPFERMGRKAMGLKHQKC